MTPIFGQTKLDVEFPPAANTRVPPAERHSIRRPPIDALTGLRFCAAMYVFFFHYGAGYSARLHLPTPFTTFLTHGYLGVTFFFVLSGFILTYTYSGNLHNAHDLRSFFMARFARMYPVYLLALLIALPMSYPSLHPRNTVLTLLLLQAWGPVHSTMAYTWIIQAWTLSVEAFFYLLFPIFLLAIQKLQRKFLVLGIYFFSAVIGLLALPTTRPGMPHSAFSLGFVPITLLHFPEFIFGMLIGQYVISRDKSILYASKPRWIVNLSLLVPVAVLGCTDNPILVSFAAASVGWLIYRTVGDRGLLQALLGNRAMLALGGASYAIYLLQEPIRHYVGVASIGRFSRADPFVALFTLLGLSLLIFFFYEQPMRHWIRKIFR